MMMAALAPERREQLHRRGLRLEYATLGWNVVEIGFLIAAAVWASSVALAGFALDSLIEIFASIVVVRQLKGLQTPSHEPAGATKHRHRVLPSRCTSSSKPS